MENICILNSITCELSTINCFIALFCHHKVLLPITKLHGEMRTNSPLQSCKLPTSPQHLSIVVTLMNDSTTPYHKLGLLCFSFASLFHYCKRRIQDVDRNLLKKGSRRQARTQTLMLSCLPLTLTKWRELLY
jgi:hypothetical protein